MAMYMQQMQPVAYASGPADMSNMTPSYPSTPWGMHQDQSPASLSPAMSPTMSPSMSPMQSPSVMPSQWDMQQQQQQQQPMPQTPQQDEAAQWTAEPAVPTTVLLKGLPNGMCASSAYMEVVLDEAGLDGTIIDIKVTQGDPCGRAVIKFNSWHSAAHCIRHFSGCIWDEAGMPVSACFAKTKTSTGKRGSTTSDGAPSPMGTPSGSRKTPTYTPTANKSQWSAPCVEAPSKAPRPTLTKQASHEDSDGAASGSTRSTKSSPSRASPPRSPHSRPLWADIVSDDED